MGELPVAEVDFNMADFVYGEYNPVKLRLKKCPENDQIDIDPEETYLSIGLKGTRAQNPFADKRTAPGSQHHRQKASRNNMDSISDNRNLGDRPNSINAMQSQDSDRLKKENRLLQKEQQREITMKNTKINNLFTEIENLKTDQNLAQSDKTRLSKNHDELQTQIADTKH